MSIHPDMIRAMLDHGGDLQEAYAAAWAKGIPPQFSTPLAPPTHESIIEADARRKRGETWDDISQDMGIQRDAIRRAHLKWQTGEDPRRTPPRRNIRKSAEARERRAKLAASIMALAGDGLAVIAIAKRVGCGKTLVHRIIEENGGRPVAMKRGGADPEKREALMQCVHAMRQGGMEWTQIATGLGRDRGHLIKTYNDWKAGK